MKVLLVGGGNLGSTVLKQLLKSKKITVILSDLRETPPAVDKGLKDKVDFVGSITPMNIKSVIAKYSPDLIVIASTSLDTAMDKPPSGDVLAHEVQKEVAEISSVPVLIIR
jgi:carbamoylphosphate synthase large subunit